jgi:hypothetical protein
VRLRNSRQSVVDIWQSACVAAALILAVASLSFAGQAKKPARPAARAGGAKDHASAGGPDLPLAARRRRQDEAEFLRRADRPRSGAGIIIKFPPHRGALTLRFDLHTRHTYSEDEMRQKRGFASYSAGIGVLTMDNMLLTRAWPSENSVARRICSIASRGEPAPAA